MRNIMAALRQPISGGQRPPFGAQIEPHLSLGMPLDVAESGKWSRRNRKRETTETHTDGNDALVSTERLATICIGSHNTPSGDDDERQRATAACKG